MTKARSAWLFDFHPLTLQDIPAGMHSDELEINDYPQIARQKITHRDRVVHLLNRVCHERWCDVLCFCLISVHVFLTLAANQNTQGHWSLALDFETPCAQPCLIGAVGGNWRNDGCQSAGPQWMSPCSWKLSVCNSWLRSKDNTLLLEPACRKARVLLLTFGEACFLTKRGNSLDLTILESGLHPAQERRSSTLRSLVCFQFSDAPHCPAYILLYICWLISFKCKSVPWPLSTQVQLRFLCWKPSTRSTKWWRRKTCFRWHKKHKTIDYCILRCAKCLQHSEIARTEYLEHPRSFLNEHAHGSIWGITWRGYNVFRDWQTPEIYRACLNRTILGLYPFFCDEDFG